MNDVHLINTSTSHGSNDIIPSSASGSSRKTGPQNMIAANDSITSVSLLSSTNSEHMNSSQITHTQYVTLLCHMEDIKKQMTRIEVKLDQGQNATIAKNEHAIGTIDLTKLQLFGVPVKSKDQLQILEDKLKNEVFRNGLVSAKFQFRVIKTMYSF